jgi:cobalt-zinc-cadmium resistance protein CzcA
MVRRLIEWAVNNTFIVLILVGILVAVGVYSFLNVNVEAYPDPAPAIIEIIAQYPGFSAEEVERQVTIPLEIALAGMPGLQYTRTKSLEGLSHLRNQFLYGVDYYAARQEVINRLGMVQGLPASVSPQISPMTPTGELIRYTLSSPKDRNGNDIYTLADLKSTQDWVLERAFRRLPLIADVGSYGGKVKRYEISPDPDRLRRYGITLAQVTNAVSNSNANLGAGFLTQGAVAMNVRTLGLFGRGKDPVNQVLGLEKKVLAEIVRNELVVEVVLGPSAANAVENAGRIGTIERLRGVLAGKGAKQRLEEKDLSVSEQDLLREVRRRQGRLETGLARREADPPLTRAEHVRIDSIVKRAATEAAFILRDEERNRIREIRGVVITSVNNVPVRLEDLVGGGPSEEGLYYPEGVFVGFQPRLGKVGISRPRVDASGEEVRDQYGNVVWNDEDDKIQGIVMMRKNEPTLKALDNVNKKVDEFNKTPGALLPGVQLQRHFDLTGLLDVTTETVRENLILGMSLVTIVLFMFLTNVRSALIVAINVPLALLFAFSVLYFRGKSANLLSIGAVDFGIIVDSSVIMVENIYRHISSGEYAELPLKERIIRACHEVERPLFFSTAIMVCAFIPLFTMQGPEGQIFGPMADTYAFALGGALLLALTIAPAMCLLLFKGLGPSRDNALVRWLKSGYLKQLDRCLRHRWLTLGLFGLLTLITAGVLPLLDREFMPELEEGNLYIRGTFPVNISLEESADKARRAREIMRSFPEVSLVASQVGRPDDGTDPTGFYNIEFHVPLRPEKEWPATVPATGWRRWFGLGPRARTKPDLITDMNADLNRFLPGVDWNFSQYIRDNVMEALSGVKGDNSVKIIGPDLDKLEELAEKAKNKLEEVDGIRNVGVFRIMGQPNLEFTVDRARCTFWGVSVADVENAIRIAVGGQAVSSMIEGEKLFDITIRWPERLRGSEEAILEIPVDVTNNTVTSGFTPGLVQTPVSGAAVGVSTIGHAMPLPSLPGNMFNAAINNITSVPRLRLRHLVTPVNEKGEPDPKGTFLRPGASTIYREQGKRLVAVKFSIEPGRGLAAAVAKAQEMIDPEMPAGYTTEWSGEFQEMKEAEGRLGYIIPISLALVFALLYLAFHDFVDALLVFSNVIALSLGGVWALFLTGTHFSISAAVGFISIFGVAIMDGLLLVSYFNHMRAQGLPLQDAIMQGAEKRVRPVMMTALTAIFGLLPAALSTRIGAQTQRPLAIVVVGGMISTLFLTRYLMPVLYSFYGHREPPQRAGSLAH